MLPFMLKVRSGYKSSVPHFGRFSIKSLVMQFHRMNSCYDIDLVTGKHHIHYQEMKTCRPSPDQLYMEENRLLNSSQIKDTQL